MLASRRICADTDRTRSSSALSYSQLVSERKKRDYAHTHQVFGKNIGKHITFAVREKKRREDEAHRIWEEKFGGGKRLERTQTYIRYKRKKEAREAGDACVGAAIEAAQALLPVVPPESSQTFYQERRKSQAYQKAKKNMFDCDDVFVVDTTIGHSPMSRMRRSTSSSFDLRSKKNLHPTQSTQLYNGIDGSAGPDILRDPIRSYVLARRDYQSIQDRGVLGRFKVTQHRPPASVFAEKARSLQATSLIRRQGQDRPLHDTTTSMAEIDNALGVLEQPSSSYAARGSISGVRRVGGSSSSLTSTLRSSPGSGSSSGSGIPHSYTNIHTESAAITAQRVLKPQRFTEEMGSTNGDGMSVVNQIAKQRIKAYKQAHPHLFMTHSGPARQVLSGEELVEYYRVSGMKTSDPFLQPLYSSIFPDHVFKDKWLEKRRAARMRQKRKLTLGARAIGLTTTPSIVSTRTKRHSCPVISEKNLIGKSSVTVQSVPTMHDVLKIQKYRKKRSILCRSGGLERVGIMQDSSQTL
ncbi:hypothetical protein ADUPG1_005914 [Aduncisulcus paluster]|uniref:Uncharacterized protein n=1 Tax=Aduncisulcus paluster TaxID=2918883 RepID=A0ABQ5KHT9_9EUKA|nr:hypothetical protein ADUPG1_005914 [Aduncisulcus paluster]